MVAVTKGLWRQCVCSGSKGCGVSVVVVAVGVGGSVVIVTVELLWLCCRSGSGVPRQCGRSGSGV